MSDRIDVAAVQLRDSYTIDGKEERWLTAALFSMGYEEATDKLVVQRRGSGKLHVIPWGNVKGFELDTPTPAAKEPVVDRPVPAVGAGGGSRRTRPPQ